MSVQLEFFPRPIEEKVKEEQEKMHKNITKITRNLYGENSKLKGRVQTLEEELKFLKHMICNPGKPYNLIS